MPFMGLTLGNIFDRILKHGANAGSGSTPPTKDVGSLDASGDPHAKYQVFQWHGDMFSRKVLFIAGDDSRLIKNALEVRDLATEDIRAGRHNTIMQRAYDAHLQWSREHGYDPD